MVSAIIKLAFLIAYDKKQELQDRYLCQRLIKIPFREFFSQMSFEVCYCVSCPSQIASW